ncbi:MAG: hypothetical protein AB1894_15845 [Chloroflexota bacterium]
MCKGKIVPCLALVLAIGGAAALFLALGRAASLPTAAPAQLPAAAPLLIRDEWDGDLDAGQGCSTVFATDGQQVLGGNNEDSGEPLTKVWFVPAGKDTHGLVFFGYGNYRAQGGMNDQGLFFDFLSVPKELPVSLEGKQPYTGTNFIVYDAMARCATVACVVEMFEKYYDREAWSLQHFFGDATGASAIIEPQAILRQRGGFQVATNFYQSTVAPEKRRNACPRYRIASEMLESSPPLSVETMRDVMAAIHQDERRSPTVYTNVYDLVNRKIYLYYFFDYEHVAVLDLEQELAKGAHAYDLPALFPPNAAAQKYNAAAMKGYDKVIRSRRVEIDPALLAAYVGEYAPPESGPRAPGEWVSVTPYGASLLLTFPDSHRYELFPQSETSFFVVTWNKMDGRFQVQFTVNFGIDEATGQVLYMDFVFGPGEDYVRNERLNLAAYVPYIPSPATATPTPTPTPTLTPTNVPPPTAAPTLTLTNVPPATAAPPLVTPAQAAPGAQAGRPWGWALLPAALLAAALGWLVLVKIAKARRQT